MKKIVFIGGPTASGKTDLAVSIAQKFSGELINADSRQIYKYLDIGTNKGDIKNIKGNNYLQGIPIHLVSFLDPDKNYSVFDFKEAAVTLIEDIIVRGKLPIIVGGTGLYIDSIIKNYQLTTQQNTELRKELETKDLNELQQELITNNLNNYTRLNDSDRANKRRLVRLIEKLKPDYIINNVKSDYDSLFLYPTYNWEDLVIKIETRVDLMFKEGIVEEVKHLITLGFSKNSIALQGTGYKEVLSLLDGNISLQECINLVKISHRQYAKRQRTWFEGEGRKYNLTNVENAQQAENKVNEFYGSTNIKTR